MITIQRGNTKLKVSKGAFDLYYKGIGFKVVGVKAEKPVEKTEEVSKPDEKVDDIIVPKADEKSEEVSKPEEKSEGEEIKTEISPVEGNDKEPKSEGKENEAPKTPKNENPKK